MKLTLTFDETESHEVNLLLKRRQIEQRFTALKMQAQQMQNETSADCLRAFAAHTHAEIAEILQNLMRTKF